MFSNKSKIQEINSYDVVPMDTSDDYDEYYDIEENKASIKPKSTRKKAIPKVVRQNVWNTYMGDYSGKGKCFCCNYTELTSFQFECGHVISEYNGGDVNIANLRPICSLCNKSMGKKNMVEYMTKNKLPFPKNWNGFSFNITEFFVGSTDFVGNQ